MLCQFQCGLRKLHGQKVSGGALYIALLLCIAVGVLLSLLILLSTYSQKSIRDLQETDRLSRNLRSGLAIAQSSFFGPEFNNVWLPCGAESDSIRVQKLEWGTYQVIFVEAKTRTRALHKIGFYGETFLPADTGLFVSEVNRQITINQPVDFRGRCFLPRYRKLNGFQKSDGGFKNISNSPGRIPKLSDRFLRRITEQRVLTARDSLANFVSSVTNSFKKRTITYISENFSLKQCVLQGNVKLVADEIDIDSTCRLNNVLIICKKVRFGNGFKGNVHVVASDSISTGLGCTFTFPSSFILTTQNSGTNEVDCISFGGSTTFSGTAILYEEETLKKGGGKALVKLLQNVVFNGLIYTNSYLQANGIINGTAFSEKLITTNSSAMNENEIGPCVIEPAKYARLISVPDIFSDQPGLIQALTIK